MVNQSTAAVLDRASALNLGQPQYQEFGRGTMVSGIIHLVAPTALIMPLKAFRADGTGYLSDVLRAIHFAVQHDARVVNMSLDRKSTRLNSSHGYISYAVFCLKKKK